MFSVEYFLPLVCKCMHELQKSITATILILKMQWCMCWQFFQLKVKQT